MNILAHLPPYRIQDSPAIFKDTNPPRDINVEFLWDKSRKMLNNQTATTPERFAVRGTLISTGHSGIDTLRINRIDTPIEFNSYMDLLDNNNAFLKEGLDMQYSYETFDDIINMRAISGAIRLREHWLLQRLNSSSHEVRGLCKPNAFEEIIDVLEAQGFISDLQVGPYNRFGNFIKSGKYTKDNGEVVEIVTAFVYASTDGNDLTYIVYRPKVDMQRIEPHTDYAYLTDKNFYLGLFLPEASKLSYVYGYSQHGDPMIDTREIPKDFEVPEPCFYPYLDEDYTDILDNFMESKNNLLVLLGVPGTGKSSMLRQLVVRNPDKTAYQFIGDKVINHPAFDGAIASLNKDSIVIMEDADNITRSREDGNSTMAMLLNEINGICSKGIKFVISVNLAELKDMEEALLRNGRLFKALKFRKLTKDEAQVVADKCGVSLNPDLTEYTIADILGEGEKFTKQKLGFC